jgi:hypothetical protein
MRVTRLDHLRRPRPNIDYIAPQRSRSYGSTHAINLSSSCIVGSIEHGTVQQGEKQAGVEGRLLTQGDEHPQSTDHVIGSPGDPLVVSIPLRIAR